MGVDRFSLYERVSECIRVCGQVRGAQHEATLADAGVVSQCSICIGKALASGPSVALTAPLTADSLLPLTAPSHCSHSLLPLIALIAARPFHCSLSVHHLTALSHCFLSLPPLTTHPVSQQHRHGACLWSVRPTLPACSLSRALYSPRVFLQCVSLAPLCVCARTRGVRVGVRGCSGGCVAAPIVSLSRMQHTRTQGTRTLTGCARSPIWCVCECSGASAVDSWVGA